MKRRIQVGQLRAEKGGQFGADSPFECVEWRFRGRPFCEIPGQAGNDVGEIPGHPSTSSGTARNEEGGARCFDRLSNRAPSGPSTGSGTVRASDEGAGPSTGSGTGRASDEGPALRQAQGPAGQAMRARPFDRLRDRAPSGPSTGSGTGRASDKGRPALRQAQGPAD